MTTATMTHTVIEYMTLPQAAQKLNVPIWALRKLYERRLVAQARRLGPYRFIDQAELPMLAEALRAAGYLKD